MNYCYTCKYEIKRNATKFLVHTCVLTFLMTLVCNDVTRVSLGQQSIQLFLPFSPTGISCSNGVKETRVHIRDHAFHRKTKSPNRGLLTN